jgi:hypothetical protein
VIGRVKAAMCAATGSAHCSNSTARSSSRTSRNAHRIRRILPDPGGSGRGVERFAPARRAVWERWRPSRPTVRAASARDDDGESPPDTEDRVRLAVDAERLLQRCLNRSARRGNCRVCGGQMK